MFSIRDQENLVHARQTTAAGKPLNAGVKSLQPKTPGNLKTPFRPSKNDENKIHTGKGQKTVLKDGPSKIDTSAFVTPAGPRNRAPLGVKTTNAKAQPLKTPGLVQNTVKKNQSANKFSTTRRSARKIPVAVTEPVVQHQVHSTIEDDEPDFGYAPPPIIELPDPPIDFDHNPYGFQLGSEELEINYGEIYFGSPKDEHGVSIRMKKEEEEYRKQQEAELMEQIQRGRATRLDPDAEVEAMIAAGPKHKYGNKVKESKIDTVRAKTAAKLLAGPDAKLPAAATKQTASSLMKQAKPTATSTNSKGDTLLRPAQASSKGPLPVSRNTIGFPKAKKAPSIIPSSQRENGTRHSRTESSDPKLCQNAIDPVTFVELYGEPPAESEMWFRWQQHQISQAEEESLFEADSLADEISELDFFSSGLVARYDDFQLPMPDDEV